MHCFALDRHGVVNVSVSKGIKDSCKTWPGKCEGGEVMDGLIGSPDTIRRIVLIGVLSYLLLILMLRLSGKRTLSKMNAFDFIVTVALGSMLSTLIMDPSISLLEGMTAMGLLVLLQYIITFTSVRSKTVGRIIKSEPKLLFYNGEFLTENMIKERILTGELEQAIRKAGHNNYASISAVVLETDGAFSVLARDGSLVHNLESASDSPLDR